MDIIKVLLVEDAEDQQNIFKSSVEVFNHKNSDAYTVEYVLASNLDEAVTKIDGSFDGAILDLKLDQDDEGGNKVVAKLDESLIRIPVIFVTGHPELVAQHKRIVKTRPRASESYESDIELIRDIKCTGLTHIMGGRGKIEETLHHVFTHNLLPQITTWMEYGKIDSKQTEMALLRHTLNHLLQLLDDDLDLSYAEEVYISPPLSDAIKTGSILKKKDETPLFVVMNPACDLVLRADGKFKTDHVLLVEIDLEDLIIDPIIRPITNIDKKTKALKKLLGNNQTDYYHWLPKSGLFQGGFINFRKLRTIDSSIFCNDYETPKIQISPPFVKDIVSRFSSYYARQGQPDIHLSEFIKSYCVVAT